MCRKIEIKKAAIFFVNFLILVLKYCEFFLKPKINLKRLSMSRVYHDRSFLLTLAHKTRTCVMALLVPAWTKFNHNLIEMPVPYRLPVVYFPFIDPVALFQWITYALLKFVGAGDPQLWSWWHSLDLWVLKTDWGPLSSHEVRSQYYNRLSPLKKLFSYSMVE